MIDTNKYEGHTEVPWKEGEYIPSDEMIERFRNRELQGAVMQQDSNLMIAMIGLDGDGEKDRLLIADAPLLLEAYKRLRLVADELYLHIVGEPHMTLDELVAEMPWRNEE